MPDTGSHDDDQIAAELAEHPVLADNLVRFDDSLGDLNRQVAGLELRVDNHAQLLGPATRRGRRLNP